MNELWSFFEQGKLVNNWLSGMNYPLDEQWYFKFLFLNVSNLLKAILIFRLSRMYHGMRLGALVYMVYCFVDLFMFTYNFNLWGYKIIYASSFTLAGVIILIQYLMSKPKKIKLTRKNREVEIIGVPAK